MVRKKLNVAEVGQPIPPPKEDDKGIQGRFYAELEKRVKLYRDGQILLGAIQDGTVLRVWRLDSKDTTRYLNDLAYELFKRPCNQTLQIDAKALLEMLAAKRGTPCKVGLRFLRKDNVVYLDMANDVWQAIQIKAEGWNIIQPTEPLFYRRGDMLTLPTPVAGGTWEEFWSFLNIPHDTNRLLVRAWFVTSLMADMNVPLLVLSGEQGSAKSTTSRILRLLIDPHKSLLHSVPKDEQDLFVSAQGHAVLAFDNMSHINVNMSNALCKLITGGAFVTRRLYHDTDEVCLEAKRPIIINGIDDLVEKQDLISRTIMLHLPSIGEAAMQPEAVFKRRLDAALGRMLGLIIEDVRTVLAHLPAMPEEGFPSRMADYSRVGMALAEGMGIGHQAFLDAYASNRLFASETGLEVEPVAEALQRYLNRYPRIDMTAKGLLDSLNREDFSDHYMRTSNRWPKQPNFLVRVLNQLAPALRQRGILVEYSQRSASQKLLRIYRKEIGKNIVTTVISGMEPLNQTVSEPLTRDDEPFIEPPPSRLNTASNGYFTAYDDDDDKNKPKYQ